MPGWGRANERAVWGRGHAGMWPVGAGPGRWEKPPVGGGTRVVTCMGGAKPIRRHTGRGQANGWGYVGAWPHWNGPYGAGLHRWETPLVGGATGK